MSTESKLEKLIPHIDAMMLAELKMQQLRTKPYWEVKDQMEALTKEYLSASNDLTINAVALGIVDPKIVRG